MQDQLVIFGYSLSAIFALTVIIPYATRRSDLLTVWNLFLVGSFNFVGYAAVQSGNGVYSYGLFTSDEYRNLMVGTVIFYAVIYFVYYRVKLPSRVAGRTLRYWPAYNNVAMYVMWVLCMVMLWVSVFFPNVQFIGQIIIIIGPTAGMIGAALVFRNLLENPRNLVLFGLLVLTMLLCLGASLHGGTGRRVFLSALMTLPICYYWMRLRYRPLVYTVVPLVVSGLAVIVMLAAYSTIRHRYNAEVVNVTGRTSLQTAIESFKMLPSAILGLQGIGGVLGGDSMEASLVAINRYTKIAPPEPFFTLKYVAANPIPRAFWPDKPKALGETLPRDTGVWRTGYVNWGPGIPGHGFHEGGHHMLVFYGVLFGLAMRYFDELLLRQWDNPYVMGILAGASGQIIAFSRGDIGLFCVLISGAVLAGLVVKFVGRFLVGYRLIYPTDRERELAAAAAAGIAPASLTQSPLPDAELVGARGRVEPSWS
jgi:hypothetical protein